MGVSRTPNPFTAALLIGGVLYLTFALGFSRWYGAPSRLTKLVLFCLLVGGAGLALVDLFTEEAGRIHFVDLTHPGEVA